MSNENYLKKIIEDYKNEITTLTSKKINTKIEYDEAYYTGLLEKTEETLSDLEILYNKLFLLTECNKQFACKKSYL